MRFESSFKIAGRALRRNKLRPFSQRSASSSASARSSRWSASATARRRRSRHRSPPRPERDPRFFRKRHLERHPHGFGSAGTLTIEDAEAIRREVPGVDAVSPEVRDRAGRRRQSKLVHPHLRRVGRNTSTSANGRLRAARIFTAQDVRSANKVCVIGQTTARQLFGDEDPVGQIFRIKSVPFPSSAC